MRSKVKASEFVAKAVEIASEYKTVYMWGTFGAPLSEKVIRQKAEQYPSHYGSTKQKNLRAKLGQGYFAFDCVGLIKGILWGWNGDGSKNYGGGVYAANGVPDTNVGGMMKLCTEVSTDWSGILPGELVATSDHIGIYIGGGKVAEATPAWEDGVQISACANRGTIKGLNSRKWDKHGKLKFLDYREENDMSQNISYAWSNEAVEWAVQNKILIGDENGDYMLDKPCTRREMVVFLHRLYQLVK